MSDILVVYCLEYCMFSLLGMDIGHSIPDSHTYMVYVAAALLSNDLFTTQ